MREILFRGKSVQTDEWITGSLIIDENNRYYIGRAVTPKVPVSFGMPSRRNGKTLERFIGIGFVMVYPETVGEFTGCTDRFGFDIYEGDIVDILTENEENGVIAYDDGGFQVEADGFILDFHSNINGSDLEIIGNVHDNPLKLQGGE
jgi:hypothetical protein